MHKLIFTLLTLVLWLSCLLAVSEAEEPHAGRDRSGRLFADLTSAVSEARPRLEAPLLAPLSEARSRVVRADMLAAVRAEVRSRRTSRLVLNLFHDATFEAIIERTTETRSGYTLSGRLEGDPLSSVTLVVNGNAVAGMVNSVEGTWHLQSRGAGVVEVRKSEGTFRPVRHKRGSRPRSPLPAAKFRAQANQDDADSIDVLVIFTGGGQSKRRRL